MPAISVYGIKKNPSNNDDDYVDDLNIHMDRFTLEKNRLTFINLTARSIESMEFVADNFPALETLKLAGNKISEIPLNISLLKNLKYLELGCDCFGGNLIKSIPDAIGDCGNLQILDISHNQLVEISPNIVNCPLVELRMKDNKLSEIPSALFKLQKLEVLIVANNRLREIPIDIYDLSQLQLCDVSHNQLSFVSRNLLMFLSKRSFLLTGNPFDHQQMALPRNRVVSSLSELCMRTLVNECEENLYRVPSTVLEKYVSKNVNWCSCCEKEFYDEYHVEIAFDHEFGLGHVPCRYSLCSSACVKKCRKDRLNLEW